MTTLQQRHQGPHHTFSLPTSSTLSPNTPLTLPSLIPVRITNRDTIASQCNSIANGLVNPEQLRQVRHTKQIPTTLTSTRIHNPANCVQITHMEQVYERNWLYSQSGCFRFQESFRPDLSQYIGSKTKRSKYTP